MLVARQTAVRCCTEPNRAPVMPLFCLARSKMKRSGDATTMTALLWTAPLFLMPRATNEGETLPTLRLDAVDPVVSAEALDAVCVALRHTHY